MVQTPEAPVSTVITPRLRLAGHGLFLAGVLAMLLVSGPGATRAQPLATAAQGGGVAQGAETAVPEWLRTTGKPSKLTPPDWVRSSEETSLWSGPDDRALIFNSVPVQTYLRPLGPVMGGRMLVYYGGDGGSRAPGPAWVDLLAVAPSTAPPATAAGPTGAESALRPVTAPAPRRIGNTKAPGVTAYYVAVIDEASGELLYGEDERKRVPMASTTKIATTLVALEREPNLKRVINVTVNGSAMAARDGSSIMGLEPGEKVTLETLLFGMMLPSGNDAAEQVALALAGSRERYVQWMNDRARELGLKDTQFANPSGMDAPGHYSSAYDMAMLGRAAMRNAAFRAMAGAHYYYGDGYNLRNLNAFVNYYDGADGIKIGFTDDARKTIVASATRDGRRVYVSLLRSEDLVGDSTALFDWVWRNFAW